MQTTQTLNPQHSAFDALGGEAGVRDFVKRIYQYMDTLPEVRGIRAMHAADLSETVESVSRFMSGFLGGPDLFTDIYGPPMLRRRHMRFAIGEVERDQWLLCARKALDDMPVAANVREHVYTRLAATADHLRNDAGRGQPCRHDSLQSLSIQSAKAS